MLTPSITGDLFLLAIVALIGTHTFISWSRGTWILFDPLNTFWAGVLVCYVLQPISGADLFISWHGEPIFSKTLFAALWGLSFVVLGYELNQARSAALAIPPLPDKLSPAGLLVAGITLIALSLFGYYYIIQKSGGWSEWVAVGRGGTDYEAVKGYLPELANMLPAGILLLFFRAQAYRHSISSLGRAAGWLAAVILIWWFIYIGSRSRLIMTLTFLLASYYLPRGRRPSFVIVGFLVFATVLAMNFLELRGSFNNLSFNLSQFTAEELRDRLLPPFLGGSKELSKDKIVPGIEFNCALSVVDLVPEKVSYTYGYGFLEIFTRPIPRSLWSSKPYPHIEAQQEILKAADLTLATVRTVQDRDLLMGPAFAFVGYWYLTGGFVALAVGGFVTGTLLRFIRTLYDVSPRNHSMLIIYPLLLPIGFLEAASTPWYWLFTYPFLLIPLVLLLRFIGQKSCCASPETQSDALRSGARSSATLGNCQQASNHYSRRDQK